MRSSTELFLKVQPWKASSCLLIILRILSLTPTEIPILVKEYGFLAARYNSSITYSVDIPLTNNQFFTLISQSSYTGLILLPRLMSSLHLKFSLPVTPQLRLTLVTVVLPTLESLHLPAIKPS
jgi:hypothetical protein